MKEAIYSELTHFDFPIIDVQVTTVQHVISTLPVTFRSPVRGSNLTIRALSKARAADSINSLLFRSNEGSS
jgi:hypothetical protein